MGRRIEDSTVVPVEEIMPFVPDGLLNTVPLQETRDGRLGAMIPDKGRGRYSLRNAIKRKPFFELPLDSLQTRRQWNSNNRLDQVRRGR